MLNVLVNAYAVNPDWGSEPGMGWNWISNLAGFCNLFIITEGEWKDEIESAVAVHPFRSRLHFYYLPVSDEVRRMCWNQGDWRFYWHYRKWQERALELASEIVAQERIDVVHQLNMIGFREPGYLWKLDKPLVWGPIGGIVDIPGELLQDAPLRMRLFLKLKELLSLCQMRFSPRIDKALRRAGALVSAVPEAERCIRRVKHLDSVWIPETGCYDHQTQPQDKRLRKGFDIMWVGKFDFRKRLDVALKSVAKAGDLPDLRLHIVGTGSESQVQEYHDMAKALGIGDKCIWHGKVDNQKVQEMMRDADLFLFTSVSEATSTVVPEAINNCLPILCFNICGFGPLVTEQIGRTVEPQGIESAVNAFAEHIRTLYGDRELLHRMSLGCKDALRNLLWENKARQVADIYSSLV